MSQILHINICSVIACKSQLESLCRGLTTCVHKGKEISILQFMYIYSSHCKYSHLSHNPKGRMLMSFQEPNHVENIDEIL